MAWRAAQLFSQVGFSFGKGRPSSLELSGDYTTAKEVWPCAGGCIMGMWDSICQLLRAREVSVEDVSNKVHQPVDLSC